jgi:RNA polymerase sigma-70 factor (ECF subfamily)
MATLSCAMNAGMTNVIPTREFQLLYQQYSDVVFRTAMRVTGNTADAEDVLQTVFMRALHQQIRCEEGRSPQNYLRRAATNASIDVLRRRAARPEAPLEGWREEAPPVSDSLLKERLRRALARLDPDGAELFLLRYVEGLSNVELAEHFGIERGTVASRLHRIREFLQKEMER